MLLARSILLRPNDRQAKWLAQNAGYARWTYNTLLGMLNEAIEQAPEGERWPGIQDLAKELRPEWALELSQNTFEHAARNLENALKRWRDCRQGKHNGHRVGECGFPKFHKRTRNVCFQASDTHPVASQG